MVRQDTIAEGFEACQRTRQKLDTMYELLNARKYLEAIHPPSTVALDQLRECNERLINLLNSLPLRQTS